MSLEIKGSVSVECTHKLRSLKYLTSFVLSLALGSGSCILYYFPCSPWCRGSIRFCFCHFDGRVCKKIHCNLILFVFFYIFLMVRWWVIVEDSISLQQLIYSIEKSVHLGGHEKKRWTEIPVVSCQQNEKKINDFLKSCAVTAEMHKNTTVVVQTKRALSELGVLAPAWTSSSPSREIAAEAISSILHFSSGQTTFLGPIWFYCEVSTRTSAATLNAEITSSISAQVS